MRTAVFALGIAILASACNAGSARTDEHSPTLATTSAAITTQPSLTWPTAASADEGALGALTLAREGNDTRALVARSVVPVLAPRELRLASPTLVVEGEFFALTGRAGGATISLQGTRAAHRYEDIAPTAGNRDVRRGSGVRGFVSVNEGIRTASWIENGAAYSVDVECSDFRDARCQSDDFLLSVVAQLVFVGGSGR